MDKNDLNEARTNPDFLKYLEETRIDAINKNNIAALYEVLDSMLILDLDEKKINEVYENILKTSFSNVDNIVNSGKKLKLKDEELFYIRAFYEHAIEKWSYGDIDGAKQLIFILINILEDQKLQDSLKVHLIALNNNSDLDSFYENSVESSLDNDEKYGYFIVSFNFEMAQYLKDNALILEQENKNLKYLLD
ncbi:hypothetical protein CPU12_08625 [Malaciobacter molluscorum LMG 25693]|uniref:Uncharacterized protein n=1 Tax=Malaciobacter molluscorum LMG 25693 TaxID=870501 RepID=A0A2G1DH57_9BACT|nr:hypothetical protein [Malaciobacter molluscorum]AXX93410.1 hypothetical protein AMOL_2468 [Malaciobacter molluscorum LMG 25693]PHO17813.1 hypothetical protein CPU12_08625 [Malaciobacter molluscorum LMG 25693]RXJ95071.1 hypothetical protein CRV00_04765 [Malaciobacter molluscorum]